MHNIWRTVQSYYAVVMRPTSTLKFLNGYYSSSPRSEFSVLWGRRRQAARKPWSTICTDVFSTRVHVNVCCTTADCNCNNSRVLAHSSPHSRVPSNHYLLSSRYMKRNLWRVKKVIRKLKVPQHGKRTIKDDKSSNWVQPPSEQKATSVKLPHLSVLTETQFRKASARIQSPCVITIHWFLNF